MLNRILVPLDGSTTAEAVLPQVRRLIRGRDTELILVQAAHPIPVEAHAGVFDASLAAAEEYLRGAKGNYLFRGVSVRTVARLGVPTDVILGTIRDEKPDLVAMATHGRTGLARLILGSTAEQILRESSVPVLAVRPFWTYELTPAVRPEDSVIGTLLLPLDGSPESDAAIPETVSFARTFGARTLLLRVLGLGEGPASASYQRAEGHLREAVARFHKQGCPAHSMIANGDPVTAVGDVARLHEVDLIVMATHGRSGLRRVVMGSVTERVLRGAKVPLLIVRSTAAATAGSAAQAAGHRSG